MERHVAVAKLLILLPTMLHPAWSRPADASRIPPHSSRSSHEGAVPSMDTATHRGVKDFQDAYVGAIPFFHAADMAKVEVDPESVTARMAVYAELYPGQALDSRRVENLLKAEKYLAAQGKGVDDREVENRLSALGAASATFKDGNREALRQALKADLLFRKEEVRRLGEEVADLEAIRNQDVMESSRMVWPLESLRLQGPPDACLAKLEGECCVTLEEYNAVLGEIRIPRAIPLDSAKATALRRYLVEKQYAMAEPAGSDDQADSILAAMKSHKDFKEWHERSEGMGRRVRDPKILWETYHRYYRDLFKARMEATVEVVGSSDSLHIDSLYRVLKKWEKEDSTARNAGRKPPEEPPLPWLDFKEEELPRAISSSTDTLQPGRFTRPVRTHLGYFLARVRGIRRLKEVSFQEAQPRLMFLATRDKFLRMDSVVAAKSLKYYRTHEGEFRIPDTLELTAWLVPFRIEGKGKPKRYLLSSHPEKDTLAFAHLKISSLWLPRKWQTRLHAFSREETSPKRKGAGNKLIGPLKGEFGQWYFRIEKERRAAGVRPYAAVKAEIIRRLTSPEIEPDTLARDSVKEEILLTLGMARSSKSKESSKWQSLPADEIERLIRTRELDTAGFPSGLGKDGLIELSRQRWVENNRSRSRDRKRELLKQMEIDYPRLFRP